MANNKYPVKQDLNLAQRERRTKNLRSVLLTALVLAVGIGLFCKFAVVDRLRALSEAQAAAVQTEQLLAQVRAVTADYDQVLKEYQGYTLSQTAMGGKADALDCLNLIEAELLKKSQVSQFTVADSLISVELSGVTLQQVSGIYAGLMASELVENVQVFTAANTTGDPKVSAAITIQLHTAEVPEVPGTEEEAAS
ncbi:MAG: hypothetical protein RR350_05495 [Oscillibacter sp.]